MMNSSQTSQLQRAIDIVEALSLEEQQLLLDIFLKRLQWQRRQQLVRDVQEVRREVAQGNVQFGSVQDFLTELEA